MIYNNRWYWPYCSWGD